MLTVCLANPTASPAPQLKLDFPYSFPNLHKEDITVPKVSKGPDVVIISDNVVSEKWVPKENPVYKAQGVACQSKVDVSVLDNSKARLRALSAARGWDGFWQPLYSLVDQESGFNPFNCNPTSGACGLPQALPCSKLASSDIDYQVTWLLNYIRDRYGNPANAWATWQSRSPHWY